MGSASIPPVLSLPHSIAVDRKASAEISNLAAHLRFNLSVALRPVPGDAVQHVGDEMADLAELRDTEAAGRSRRRAQPHARSDGVFFRIARDRVLIDGDAGAIEHLLRRHARRLLWP